MFSIAGKFEGSAKQDRGGKNPPTASTWNLFSETKRDYRDGYQYYGSQGAAKPATVTSV